MVSSASGSGRNAAGRQGTPNPRRDLTRQTRVGLYSARRTLPLAIQEETGLRMPVQVYFKDPLVAETNPSAAIDTDFLVPWEPNLRDGPTSARFAVVDFDATNNVLTAPAVWDEKRDCYVSPAGEVLDGETRDLPQFHQLSTWAIVQHTLDFFESGFALGRPITWGFEGSRLIIVPHAGYGENAYYDRTSKSLQFYWFDSDKGRIYTCLSSDIVNHEFGHAVLDGLRPLFLESLSPETSAFHEFLGDLTAILMALRNNSFREVLLKQGKDDLASATLLAHLAQQFGDAVTNQPYLRSALNELTMWEAAGDLRPHFLSQVLTGAMFDIIMRLFERYQEKQLARFRANPEGQKPSLRAALWNTIQRMQMVAIQPLDFLPPCEATFRDYALAVLRSDQVANPTDPDHYRELMVDVFIKRGILEKTEREPLLAPDHIFDRPDLDVYHNPEAISASRGDAYRFLDDNRSKLYIPPNADLVVTEIVRARKLTREARRLPEQTILQYVWREELPLEGERFGRFAGQRTTMLCGATIVIDQNGNFVHWVRKPGSDPVGTSKAAQAEREAGLARREAMLDVIAARIRTGMIGETLSGEFGLLARASPPFGFRTVDGTVRFELAPHFSIHDDAEDDSMGGRLWQISS